MADDSVMRSDDVDVDDTIDMEHYRTLVQRFIGLRRYKTALFWSEKVCVMAKNQPRDVYWMAQCMFLLKEYQRAAHIIKSHYLEKSHIFCFYLLTECYYEAKDYGAAIDLLNTVDLEYLASSIAGFDGHDSDVTDAATLHILDAVDTDAIGPDRSEIMASIYYLKGKILESMDNRIMAMNSFIEALHLNVHCAEAFEALIQHEMLLATEERELIGNLPFDRQCVDNQRKIIERLYTNKLKKYNETANPTEVTNVHSIATIRTIMNTIEKAKSNSDMDVMPKLGTRIDSPRLFTGVDQTPASVPVKLSKAGIRLPRPSALEYLMKTPDQNVVPMELTESATTRQSATKKSKSPDRSKPKDPLPVDECLKRLDKSLDIVTEQAATLFYECEYEKCISVLDKVLKRDPYYAPALIVQIGCLYEQQERSKLFCIAHKLVDLYSEEAISWYAVGCYYDLIGKSDPARRYLTKATSIDRFFGPAWLSYGHSFAKENEHDQAMAAYFKATQLMRGCHLPLLYIGVECGLTKNYELSQKFFYQAMSIAPLDVFVMHELGFIKFEYERYDEAEEILQITLDMVTTMAEKKGEPIGVRWEPLYNNLGHCYRKNKKYDRALECHKNALRLKPINSATFTAIGFVHAIKGELHSAMDYLHRALALRREDIMASALLKSCVEDLMAQDELPKNLISNADEPSSSLAKRYQKPRLKLDDKNKPKGTKIRFDDFSSDSTGPDLASLDMSMDL